MNKQLIATLAAAGASLLAFTATAQELETSVTVGYESEYIFRGVQLDAGSIQASFNATYGDAYFGIWTNQPVDAGTSDEFDFFAGYQFKASDKVAFDLGATIYHYPELEGNVEGKETEEFYFGVSLDQFAAPAFYAYFDTELEQWTLEVQSSHSIEINEKSSLELGLALGWIDLRNDVSSYYYSQATADYVYKVNDQSNLTIGVRASGNDQNKWSGNQNNANIWGGFAYNYSF